MSDDRDWNHGEALQAEHEDWRPWSPVEITRRAQQAIEAREEAVIDLIHLATEDADASWRLRKARAEAYAHIRALPKEEQPRNAEERKAWVEDRNNDLERDHELAAAAYRNQRDVIRQYADDVDLCRTLLVSHRGID